MTNKKIGRSRYRKSRNGHFRIDEDGETFIPDTSRSADYNEMQRWLAEGNTPDAPDQNESTSTAVPIDWTKIQRQLLKKNALRRMKKADAGAMMALTLALVSNDVDSLLEALKEMRDSIQNLTPAQSADFTRESNELLAESNVPENKRLS